MITKHRLIATIGVLIILNSVLFGLPFPYESFLNIVLGVCIVVLAYLLTREKRTSAHRDSRETKKRGRVSTPEVFVESQPRINRSVTPPPSVSVRNPAPPPAQPVAEAPVQTERAEEIENVAS